MLQPTQPHLAPRRPRPTAKSIAAGSVYAFLLDRQGGGRGISWARVRKWRAETGLLWLVGRPDGEETQRWLRLESGLSPEVTRILLRPDNRPQCLSFPDEGVFLSLRGGGLIPDLNPEMMYANIWVEADRVILLRPFPIHAFSAIRDGIKKVQGPKDTGELLTELIEAWTVRIEQILFGIDREVDDMEDDLLMDPDADLHQDLTSLRHRMIHLRRHLIPQSEALSALQRERSPWLHPEHRRQIHEEYGRLHQYVAELDSARERAVLIQEEIRNSQSRRLNETMKIIAVFTAYLLPVNAITSLLGTNLEGIPGQAGTSHPWAFLIGVLSLLGVMALSYFIFKKKKWFD
jgi:zinc transporter